MGLTEYARIQKEPRKVLSKNYFPESVYVEFLNEQIKELQNENKRLMNILEENINKMEKKIYVTNEEDNVEMKEFIDEIIKVMKKYNLSISHEDSHGSFIIEKYDDYNIRWLKNAMKNYWKKVKKMFEVTYSMEGIIRKIMINASDSIQAQQIFTNMYGSGKVQIINIRRV